MKLLSRALPPLAALVALSLAAIPASAAPARKPVASKPAAAKTDSGIIPLPLNPVVPAAQRVCAAKTASGLGYTMLRPASGAKPAASDYVLVNYIGYLAADGAVFDQGMRSALQADAVIPGFSEGLQLMAKTGVARLCIPAALGYGAQAAGPIPANADLVFQIELLDFKTAAQVEAMRKQQQPASKDAPATPQ